ncbi:MAG: alpha-ribazole phosphatase [Dehalococcoidia bacterium]
MARLILVRHGQTEWNRLKRYQGQTDIELNETGIKQVQRAANRLAQEKIDAIYCSDLKRARQTAEIIASPHNRAGAIQESPLLREMSFGDYEGLTFEEMDPKFQLIFSADPSWRSSGPDVRAPNGESIADLAARVEQFTRQIIAKHTLEETVLIVAHGGPLQVLICQLLGIGTDHWWQIRLSGASVSILETYPQGASIILLNGGSHLK